MAVYSAENYYVGHLKSVDEATLPAADCTIEGDRIVWDLGTTLTVATTVTIRDYDATRANCYKGPKPLLVIKSSVDASTYNVSIDDEDGTTLWTFSADNSSTAGFAAFTVDADGAWELI